MATVVHPTRTTTRSTMRLVIELSRAFCMHARAMRPRAARLGSLACAVAVLALVALPAAAGAESSGWRISRDPTGDGILLPGGVWVAGDVTLGVEVPEEGGSDHPAIAEID